MSALAVEAHAAGDAAPPWAIVEAALRGLVAGPPPTELASALDTLAGVAGGLPGVARALVAAFDPDGVPLGVGSRGLPATALSSEGLARLWSARGPTAPGSWSPITPDLRAAEPLALLASPGETPPLVMLAVGLADDAPARAPVLEALSAHAACMVAWVRAVANAQAWSRTLRLRDLAVHGIADPPRDLRRLVDELARLFRADEATLLLEEVGELRLAASTGADPGRGEPLVRRPGEGLIGDVFIGCAVRLAEVHGGCAIDATASSPQAGAGAGEGDAPADARVHFLGVPLKKPSVQAVAPGKAAQVDVVGVLCLTRGRTQAPFTASDEAELTFVADLLGVVLGREWESMILRSVLDSPSEAVAVSRWERTPHGPSRPIVKLNRGCRRLLGWEERDLVGRDAATIYAPDAYKELTTGLAHAVKRARNGQPADHGPVVTRLKRRDGAEIPAEVSYRIVSNRLLSPPTRYTIGFARDVAARERLAQLLAALGIAYFRADRQGRTVVSSPAESHITGYSPAELRGLPREELYVDRHERRLLVQKARLGGGAVRAHLQQFRKKNGQRIWVEGDMRLLTGPRGGDDGVEGFYRDVTDRIKVQGFVDADARRALTDAELLKKLTSNAQFQMDYLTSLGHQLQTPLRNLVESLKNLQVGLVDPSRMAERIPYMIGQAVVCSRLVRNLSYMDKILRREPFRRRTVALARLAIETQIDFRHLLAKNKLALGVEEHGLDAHCQVSGHNEMLRQVVVNLVDNAIKYSLPGTRIVVRGHPGAVFEISNRGLRIPVDQRERIFERGFRSWKAIALVPHGTGFGLWLVRKILEAHDATIRCFEQEEKGGVRTVFQIKFAEPAAGEGGKR
jgi:PAS domain S-box-containing protein